MILRRAYLTSDDGMHGGTAVAHHKQELGVGEQLQHVCAHLEHQRVLVAQSGRRVPVPDDHLQAERSDGVIEYGLRYTRLLQPHTFFL